MHTLVQKAEVLALKVIKLITNQLKFDGLGCLEQMLQRHRK